ncbi:hypothetical protein EHS25_007893 [Saitozyma podzolica]|uniref:CoA-binding domain-containing protein n=1 Tax=Saitozyma podzolica TaxID=1890683 RepID=A0A427YR37_9TREE|nr:hypothetical protein EHS25_007893 [Saitozyma podzolica]
MALKIFRARAVALRVGNTARRRLHLTPGGAAELLRRQLPDFVSDDAVQGGILIRLIASRQLNVPAVHAKAKDGSPAVLPLDISCDELPTGARAWVERLGIPDGQRESFLKAIHGIWRAWLENDLVRLIATVRPGKRTVISAVEAVADDFALKKHPDVRALGDGDLIHPLERKAAEGGLFYHKSRTEGNIGCFGYGAGVAMSTMDALVAAGGKDLERVTPHIQFLHYSYLYTRLLIPQPANFLDGGGGATEANVRAAMDVLLSDPDVRVIFINSFGGLTKMDLIANGVVEILRKRQADGNPTPPIVARLRGTGEEEAKRILTEASDIRGLTAIPDLKSAAAEAVRISGVHPIPPAASASNQTRSPSPANPLVFSRDGQYEATLPKLLVKEGDSVMSQFHNQVAQDYGTNIVGACAPNKGGQAFLDRPVFGSVREGVHELRPRIASVFVPPQSAAESIIECIEAEIPLVVAYAEGISTKDQLRVQRALRSQSRTRLIGANCPGAIFPHQRVKLGIQPLSVHSPGYVGLASRSGTISYELAAQASALGLGQSVVFGLGGDPFPGTRTWEALRFMLDDPLTRIICLVGEVGGQMEEEAATVYEEYLKSLRPGQTTKPVVGFIAGQSTQRGLMYGHSGAVWWDEQETAGAKKQRI